MSLRRITLAVLTLVVFTLSVGPALLGSLEEQQIGNRLELYQTDLLLQAQEFSADDDAFPQLRQAIVGKNPLEGPIEQYQSVRENTVDSLEAAQADGEPAAVDLPADSQVSTDIIPQTQAQQEVVNQRRLLNRLDLRLGILQAETGNLPAARDRWRAIDPLNQEQAQLVDVLEGLWSDPPQILPNAEMRIQQSLQGWFQTQALTQLYRLQQRSDALSQLRAEAQATARLSLIKLAVLGIGPALGGIVGVGLLVFLGVQRFTRGEEALLAETKQLRWTTPWNWEITWQVLIVGFFFIGQIVLPLLLVSVRFLILNPLLDGSVGAYGGRVAAASTLVAYLLLALASIGVLYLSIRRYRPLPEDWFRLKLGDRWPLWGLGGYFAAVPLVIGVSILNQQLWQGRGGSNPLLQVVLEETDPVALGLFFFTAAIAAPVFEEFLFRGFLLPSLTRYMAVWPAIALSAFIFAAAHLSVSEILPLMTLGIVLGFVYTRSRNLLAPMLLHSLWNSATMLGLLILGSVE